MARKWHLTSRAFDFGSECKAKSGANRTYSTRAPLYLYTSSALAVAQIDQIGQTFQQIAFILSFIDAVATHTHTQPRYECVRALHPILLRENCPAILPSGVASCGGRLQTRRQTRLHI